MGRSRSVVDLVTGGGAFVPDGDPEVVQFIGRIREHASLAVFAHYLNVTKSLVSQWERGEKRSRGASLKLLTLVAENGLGSVA